MSSTLILTFCCINISSPTFTVNSNLFPAEVRDAFNTRNVSSYHCRISACAVNDFICLKNKLAGIVT